jgi:hypothetical protein
MLRERRERFNREFSQARADGLRASLEARAGVPVEFPLSETPCFLPASLLTELTGAAGTMIDALLGDAAYRTAADAVVPPRFRVAHGETRPTFIQVDFGLIRTEHGHEGRLVELQAFPSLYGFQAALADAHVETWAAEGLTPFLGGLDRAGYLRACAGAIVGAHDPAEVVLLEIDPEHQKTRPDFAFTEQFWGVRAVDVRAVRRKGRHLVYQRDGRSTRIRRVYNRVIPDELERRRPELAFDFRDDLDVEWAGGPDWFFRISKFSIPWLRHPWVPRTSYLSDLASIPADREAWLLKPVFSFAGGGILFAPTDAQIAAIPVAERSNYVLQERVAFAPVIDTPHGATQVEIRLMYVRDGAGYRPLIPLLRMGRGRMMGVDHNAGLKWVGSSAALIDPAR